MVGRAEMCAIPPGGCEGGLATASTGAGVGEDVVVASVVQLALSLAPSAAVCVHELPALPLLPPEPANKYSTD